jgi:hypothetical protein
MLFGVTDVESGDAGDQIGELRERRVLVASHRARCGRGPGRSDSSALVCRDRNDAADGRLEKIQVVACGRGRSGRRRLRRGSKLRLDAPHGARQRADELP